MYGKCHECIFADEVHDMGATFSVCNREEDFIKSVYAVKDKEACRWHISYKKIIELQDKGML